MWKHYLSALFTLGTTQWDVISDIWNGANYLAYKNVTRRYKSDWYPDGVPKGCILVQNNEDIGNRTMKMDCLESDQIWGWSSIGLVQAPMLLGGQVFVMLILASQFKLISNLRGCVVFVLTLGPLITLTIPFPLVVLAAQTIYILKPNQQIGTNWRIAEVMIILVSLEAAAEAGPQALLQLYILLSDNERDYGLMTILSLVNSVFTIAKASITMFTSKTNAKEKSLSAGEPNAVVGFYSTVIRFLPVFCTSIIFRVVSSCITLVLLKSLGFIPLLVGAVTATVLSFKFIKHDDGGGIIISLNQGFGGIAVLASSFGATRQQQQIYMMFSSMVWLITHSTTLIVITAMVATPQYHLQHWKNTARIPLLAEDNVHILYIIIGILILVGILNVFLVCFQIFTKHPTESGSPVGIVEPYLRNVVKKMNGCWTSCRTQTLACCKVKCCCCCTGDIQGKEPQSLHTIEFGKDGTLHT